MSLFNRLLNAPSLWKFIIIIIGFSLYFILEANNQYWNLIPISSSIKIGLGVFTAMLFTFTVLYFFIQVDRAALLVCWLAIHYLYFKTIYVGIVSVSFLSILRQYKFYLPLLLIATIVITVIISRLPHGHLKKLLSYLTVLVILLFLLEFYRSIRNIITISDNTVFLNNAPTFKPFPTKEKADVFLIVMDEYTGLNQLTEYYNFRNDSFFAKLRSNGFFVAQNPKSNYNSTLFSTLSLLNMAYLDTSSMGDIKSARSYAKLAKAIETNLVFDFFQLNGYNLINNSFFRIKHTPDKPFLFLPIEDRLIINKTFGNILKGDLLMNIPSNKIQFAFGSFYAKSDTYNQNAIERVKRVAFDTSKRVFMYTHLMMPHSPYLRNAKGELRNLSEVHKELKLKKYGRSYVNYLEYCNKVVGEIVDSILKFRPNSNIVLVSDHGNRFLNYERKEHGDFANFIAVYSPDKNYQGFNDSVCLVNVFRLLLNNQFNQKFNLLPNYQTNVTKGVIN